MNKRSVISILNLVIISVVLITQSSCEELHLKPELDFVYSVDKKGVYLHSLKANSDLLIYSTDKVFLNDYFIVVNDSTLQAGHQSNMRSEEKDRKVYSKYFYRADGDSTFITDNPPYTVKDKYDYLTDSIFYIDINSGTNYLVRTIDYEHYEHETLNIKTREFNEFGQLISEKDTSFNCGGTSTSSKGIRFCDFKRFYSSSEIIQGKTVISKRGDLILKEQETESVLLKFDGNFDPKFGSGYYNPTLSSNGQKVSFQYLAGFLKSGSCIYEMKLKTKSKTKLVGEGFSNPLYSPDNRYLLLFSNNRQAKKKTWINDIYILDVKSKTKRKVAEGENYLWVPQIVKAGNNG